MASKNTATPESQSSPSSSLSPDFHSIVQSQATFEFLNDDLYTFADKILFLQNENSRLTQLVQTTQEMVTREMTDRVTNIIKSRCDEQLLDASNLLNAAHSEKAKLEHENKELKADLAIKTSSLKVSESSNRALDRILTSANMKCNEAEADAKKWNSELLEVKKERDILKKEVDDLRNQLEVESSARENIDNNTQSLREMITLKDQTFMQQLTETFSNRQIENSEINSRLAEQYEAKKQSALHELREQYEAQMANKILAMEELYDNKIKNLQSTASRQIDTLTGQLNDLKKQLETEKNCHAEAEIFIEGYKQEIAAYQKLLESKNHVHITPSGVAETNRNSSSTQRGATPVRLQRTLSGESEELRSSHFSISPTSKTDIEVSEVDADGQFVKIYNKGNKEIALGGYQVVRKAGDEETVFKFHRTVKIEPKTYITIWSSTLGKDHEPPHTLVMKSQKWFVSDNMTTTIIDNNGEEIATSESPSSSLTQRRHTPVRSPKRKRTLSEGNNMTIIDNNGEEIATSKRVRRPLASSTPRHREISGLLGESEELHHSQGDPQGNEN